GWMASTRLVSKVEAAEGATIHETTEVRQRAVQMLLNLISNLLDLSRLEQGEFVLDPVVARIEPVLRDAVEEIMPLAQEMEVEVSLSIADDLPAVCIDCDMIGRVVLNLLDNALKFSPPGRPVTLSAAMRAVSP